MANARLKLQRQAGKKRRHSELKHEDTSSTKVLTRRKRREEALQKQKQREEQLTQQNVLQVLLDRKVELETRLNQMTLGKPLPRLEERGYDAASGKRLERVHQDYLLQEMEWMAADFAQERKWRAKIGRLVTISLASYHKKQANRAAREKKMEEEHRRRVAARISRDVKKFWSKIDKIVSFKVKLQSEEIHKAAMDHHLKSLVSQTEKYAQALASSFSQVNQGDENPLESGSGSASAMDTMAPTTASTSVSGLEEENSTSSKKPPEEEDTKPEQVDVKVIAPQLTMSAEENDRDMTVLEPSEEEDPGEAKSDREEDKPIEDEDSDFDMEATEELEDDETTLEEEESCRRREGGAENDDDELALLQEEGELSIEELRAKYNLIQAPAGDEGDRDNDEDENAFAVEENDNVDCEDSRSIEAESRADNRSNDVDSDSDFEESAEEVDDETTIEADESRVTKEEVDHEMRLLQEESEMSIDELRAKNAAFDGHPDDPEAQFDAKVSGEHEEEVIEPQVDGFANDPTSDDGDSDFSAVEKDEPDDETTLEAEEKLENRVDTLDEIAQLQQESELDIEELRRRYTELAASDEEDKCMNVDSGADDDSYKDDGEHEENVTDSGPSSPMLVDQGDEQDEEASAKAESDIAAQAAKLSLETQEAAESNAYERPYLLTNRLKLREYQKVGINWLISMCEKRINGILADEMGLGKTIQTIALLAHLACRSGIWGPHLIIVPTSCLVNWEMEFKRWCPAFKVLTYFGNAKRRKELRQGWSKLNAFQICITSYQLIVQDAHCFKRKKWYYLILDEAHNIKNWKSLRWQTLLTFNSQRRLLLTGTPLQNNIMELWALMHFLMPHVFSSRKEFTYWFQNPLTAMIENETASKDESLVNQLHGIIRPFVLRRLKKDVAKQMPGKFEHVVVCRLSKRQRFLYEDFISRSSTRRAMLGGNGRSANFMSMMNVLMQLRKVCNHPDLFEPRPIASPFDMQPLTMKFPSRATTVLDQESAPALPCLTGNLMRWELDGLDKCSVQRSRQILFDDVSAVPLPSSCDMGSYRAKYLKKKDVAALLVALTRRQSEYWRQKRQQTALWSRLRLELMEPVYGHDLIRQVTMPVLISQAMDIHVKRTLNRPNHFLVLQSALNAMVKSFDMRFDELLPVLIKAICYVPKARTGALRIHLFGSFDGHMARKANHEHSLRSVLLPVVKRFDRAFHETFKRTQLFFPDKRLIQFDCGKLQQLDTLLRELKKGGHRCLIFTQMSSMLNILEIFLNIHGHTYFRLDGSTKVEKRQMLMEKFNKDDRIFCFILSTRSGGLGINLTGADAVIFYDSDWNPAMDAQAQDRAHRIGQTRDVHIYRLVSEHTVEENILKKAQQKRHLDFLVMAEGQFTTEFFSKANLRELVGNMRGEAKSDRVEELDEDFDEQASTGSHEEEDETLSCRAIEDAMAQLEDEEDVVAMKGAREEFDAEKREFEEEKAGTANASSSRVSTPSSTTVDELDEQDRAIRSEEEDDDQATTAEEGDGEEGEADFATEEDTAEDDDEQTQEEDAEDEELVEDEEDNDLDDEDSDASSTRTRRRRQKAARNANGGKRKRVAVKTEQDTTKKRRRLEEQAEKAREKRMELEQERQLQAWKASVSSLKGFEDSLNPVDRYALHFREEIDPLFAYNPLAAASLEAQLDEASQQQQLDVEKLEAEKIAEEESWIEEGELLAAKLEVVEPDQSCMSPTHSLSSLAAIESRNGSAAAARYYGRLYRQERARLRMERCKRQLSGDAWTIMTCVKTNHPFYFNTDTREAVWDRPAILIKNEQFASARAQGYAGLSSATLVHIMRYLLPYPDRIQAICVCHSWSQAGNSPSLFMKVTANSTRMQRLFGDSAALTADSSDADENGAMLLQPEEEEPTRQFVKMVETALPGETLLFGSGVHFLDEALHVTKPLRFLATPDAHVEIQLTTPEAKIEWTAKGGLICGFLITRNHQAKNAIAMTSGGGPKLPASLSPSKPSRPTTAGSECWQHLISVRDGGQLRVIYCDLNGSRKGNACVFVGGYDVERMELLKNESKDVVAHEHPEQPLPEKRRERRPRGDKREQKKAEAPSMSPPLTPAAACAGAAAVAGSENQSQCLAQDKGAKPSEVIVPKLPLSDATQPASTNNYEEEEKSQPSNNDEPPLATKAEQTESLATGQMQTPTSTSCSSQNANEREEVPPHPQTPEQDKVDDQPQGQAPTPNQTKQEEGPCLECVAKENALTRAKELSGSLLMLQHNRIFHAGSSGVLVANGSRLILQMNSIYGNLQSGLCMFGGKAIVRRNRIYKNGRFGLRLFNSTRHVLIEDNVVKDNPCGSLDIENSGRRFVVRMNDMIKGEPNTLPHFHGRVFFNGVALSLAPTDPGTVTTSSVPTVENANDQQKGRQPVLLLPASSLFCSSSMVLEDKCEKRVIRVKKKRIKKEQAAAATGDLSALGSGETTGTATPEQSAVADSMDTTMEITPETTPRTSTPQVVQGSTTPQQQMPKELGYATPLSTAPSTPVSTPTLVTSASQPPTKKPRKPRKPRKPLAIPTPVHPSTNSTLIPMARPTGVSSAIGAAPGSLATVASPSASMNKVAAMAMTMTMAMALANRFVPPVAMGSAPMTTQVAPRTSSELLKAKPQSTPQQEKQPVTTTPTTTAKTATAKSNGDVNRTCTVDSATPIDTTAATSTTTSTATSAPVSTTKPSIGSNNASSTTSTESNSHTADSASTKPLQASTTSTTARELSTPLPSSSSSAPTSSQSQ